jgi:zinc protease
MTEQLILGEGDVPAAIFSPEQFELDNGMEVVVVSNHRAPVVSHWVWYRVGTADSPFGKSGLPHFLEHLMFKGTEKLAPGAFSRLVAKNGGNDNAFTSHDFTAYFQMIARDRLELVMGMEADRMANLRLAEEHVLSERDVILEERSQRVDNEPGSLLGEQIHAAQWLHHPYRLPVIGWRSEIASYTRADALDFYDHWYAPNNAVLIVSGDVDAAMLRPLAEKTYGRLPRRDVPQRRRVEEPPQVAERRITLADHRVRQPVLVRSYLAPSFASAGSEHAHALDVLADLLAGGDTARLYRSLVVEQGLAAGAECSYRGTSLDGTSFQIYASPRQVSDMDRLEAALDERLRHLLRDGVQADEVARVKRRMVAEAVYARDSLSGAARIIGAAVTTGRRVEDVERWPERIAAVTIEQVDAAARAVLRPEQSVTGRLLPSDRPGQTGEGVGA